MSDQQPDKFPREILRIAACQIALSAGYTTAKASALEAVVDIMELCLFLYE